MMSAVPKAAAIDTLLPKTRNPMPSAKRIAENCTMPVTSGFLAPQESVNESYGSTAQTPIPRSGRMFSVVMHVRPPSKRSVPRRPKPTPKSEN